MARVTATEVKEVIKTSISDAIVLSSMITTATMLIDETILSEGYSTERLKAIELYLAAHFVAITEERGGLIETELGDARDKMADVYAEGLASTRYGQQGLSLDTSGKLKEATTPRLSAKFDVITTPTSL